jgi:thiol-disulfide isomerase/thioredoxin
MGFLLSIAVLAILADAGCRPSSEMGTSDATPPRRPEVVAASRQVASLDIGDPAPALSIAQWVTADPVTSFTEGRIYVVEFWATWCPPCRASVPHLNQLQRQYADQVQLIGITREPETAVREFLAESRAAGADSEESVSYCLAADRDGETHAAYLEAAGQNGIPTAFIIGSDGRLEWIGHPLMLDEPLAEVVAGNWDREAAILRSRQEKRLQATSGELNALLRTRQWDEALAWMDRFEADWGRSSVTSNRRLSILHRAGRTAATSAVRAELIDLLWDNATALNQIAWEIATEGGGRDLGLALKAARRGSELRSHQDTAILDTLARVYYEQGELDEAIRWQKKAVEHNQGIPEIDETLDAYLAEKATGVRASLYAGRDDGADDHSGLRRASGRGSSRHPRSPSPIGLP